MEVQNRREFLKSIGLMTGFGALLVVMPLVPATRWFQKWFGPEEKATPEPVVEPKSDQHSFLHLWQTRSFKDRRIRIDYSNNQVPPPEGLTSVFDETHMISESEVVRPIQFEEMKQAWKDVGHRDNPNFLMISDEQLRNMGDDFQKYLIDDPNWQRVPNRFFWSNETPRRNGFLKIKQNGIETTIPYQSGDQRPKGQIRAFFYDRRKT